MSTLRNNRRSKLVLLLASCLALTSTHPVDGRTWTSRADMPTPRAHSATAVVDGKIYVMGGFSDNPSNPAAYTQMEAYDPATDTWTRKADLPKPKHTFSANAIDGKIYIVGGQSTIPNTADLFVYDPATDTWTQKADMPVRRSWGPSASANGQLYVIGGWVGTIPQDPAGSVLVYRYDPPSDTWTQKADLPDFRFESGAASVDGKIYLLGGSPRGPGDQGALPGRETVYMYDPATDTWAQKADMPTRRRSFATAVVNGKIYAIGGDIGGNLANPGPYTSVVEVYDPATDTWADADVAPLPEARGLLTAAVVDDKIYVIGGTARSFVGLSTVTAFNPAHPQIQQATPHWSALAGGDQAPKTIEVNLKLGRCNIRSRAELRTSGLGHF